MKGHVPGKPYSDGSTDVTLPFNIPASPHVNADNRRTPTFAHAYCPYHSSPRRTALIVGGPHIEWANHFFKIGKVSIACRASGKPLCLAPAIGGKMLIVMTPKKRSSDMASGVRDARCRHGELE